MFQYILFICTLPVLIWWCYKILTRFHNRYVSVKNVYMVSNNNLHKLIIYCCDLKRYTMTYYNTNTKMFEMAMNIKSGDNILLSGYGLDSSILETSYVIDHIEFK